MIPQGPPSICWSPYGVAWCGDKINPWYHGLGKTDEPDWKTAFLSCWNWD